MAMTTSAINPPTPPTPPEPTTETGRMKISNDTLEILKNFASINSNILVKEGNTLTTISPIKNVMATVNVSETFNTEFGIWDLNKFLGTVSLFEAPEFLFEEKSVTINSQKNNRLNGLIL